MRFQHLKHWPVAEACIGPHAKLPNVGRGRVKTAGQEFVATRPGSRIAASQFHIPEERGVRFQTEQRVIGAFASIAWVVANRRPFLMAENCNDGAIQIQNQSRPVIGLVNEPLQQVVIDPVELFPKIGCSLQQKSPQALRTGVTRKAGQILKRAIRT